MKAFTSFEQSKKLAEILPIESADMFWRHVECKFPKINFWKVETIQRNFKPYSIDIPCWSLAALLEMLPTIDDGNRNPVFCKDIRLNKWHIVYHGTAIEPTIDSELYNNIIDACVEMIIKLHEKKLL